MFEYMHTVLNGLKAWVIGEVNKLLSKIDNDIAELRKTLDEASSDFVVHGTVNSDHTVTLDKTFAQISEAIGAGKVPTLEILDNYFQLMSNTERYIMFGAMFGDKGGSGLSSVYVYPNAEPFTSQYQLLNLNSNGTIPQSSMASDPTEAMQIATKKYVDDHAADDAVLYTAQTLTDAQKKQVRENIDAASYFVINVNALSGSEVTVDKTYAQISEAIKAGKTPIVYILHRSVGAVYLSLFSYYENQPITFSGTGEGEKYPYVLSVVMTAAGSTDVVADRLVEIAEDGTMRQVRMDGDPYSDMEIATKKYVDDHAGGVTTLHINVTAVNAETMEATFTADKTPAEMSQAAATGPTWCVVSFAAGIMGEEALSTGVPPAWYGGAPAFGGLVAHIHSDAGNNDINYVIRAAPGDRWILDVTQFGG